jgi:hypothetical protein
MTRTSANMFLQLVTISKDWFPDDEDVGQQRHDVEDDSGTDDGGVESAGGPRVKIQ